MKRLAILISNAGEGTNLQAIIDGIESGRINGQIEVVVSDKFDAKGLQWAKSHSIPVEINSDKQNLLPLLKKYNIDYVCLAGWKQFLTDEFIDAFENRILNLHPGLLPDTLDGTVKNPDGSDALWNKQMFTNIALQNFLDKKATYAGSSIHFITHTVDFGPVLGRCFEKIQPEDSVESLYKRLKEKENELYVDVLAKLLQEEKRKTILITDGGGRGAVLVDKYGQSNHVGKILVVPGNDLMQINTDKEVVTYPDLKTTSVTEILEICKREKVDLVDVAQDNAVEAGVVDEIKKIGVAVVGPSRLAGQIEWDKEWAREFMFRNNIKIPSFKSYTDIKKAIDHISNQSADKLWFIKAAGLAEGKGVIRAENKVEAIEAIRKMEQFGQASNTFLIEEGLQGEEFSAFALCDGENFKVIGYAQDHKRVNDGDLGPNTGGMGCVSNPLVVSENIKLQVEKIFKKAVDGLKREGRVYKGVLYLGGMVVDGLDSSVYVIEFNARWGDPEAEVIIPSIKNDLYEIDQAIIFGNLQNINLEIDQKVRIAVALCVKGYPVNYSEVKGKEIHGIDDAIKMGVKIYGAGIKKINEKYFVNGGRILYIVADGSDIVEARKIAYNAISKISVEGDNLHYRSDIGWRDVKRMDT